MPSFRFDAYDDDGLADDGNARPVKFNSNQATPENSNSGSNTSDSIPDDKTPPRPPGTPFVGVSFKCCKTYGRIYRKNDGKAYEGRCPKCAAFLTVPIGHGGSSSRFFDAG